MKKFYATLISGCFALTAAAQVLPSRDLVQTRNRVKPARTHLSPVQVKAEGDPIMVNDFSNASEWTFTDNSNPPVNPSALSVGTAGPTGYFSESMDTINSTTKDNGFALIDSDAGYATAPGQQDIKLTYNSAIDFSAYANVSMIFQSYHKTYHDSIFVEFNVNGAGWNHAVRLDRELAINDISANPKIQTLNISAIVGNQSNVQFRFRYIGEWDYAWMIDDLMFMETYSNEIVMNQIFLSTPDSPGEDYYKVPASQTNFPGVTFGGFVKNEGYSNQNALALSVTQNGGAAVLGNAVPLAVSGEDSVSIEIPVALVPGNNTFVISTDLGGPADQNPANNTTTVNVTYGGNEFARHDGLRRSGITPVDAATKGLRVASQYIAYNEFILQSLEVDTDNKSQNVGQTVFADLEIYDTDAQAWVFQTTAETEVTAENNGYLTIDFVGDVDLRTVPEGAQFRVWVGHYPIADPVVFSTAQKVVFGTCYTQFIGETDLYAQDNAPIVTLMGGTLGVSEIEAAYAVNVFPNPASNQTSVSFELKNASDVTVRVIDLTGKQVAVQKLTNAAVGKNNVSFETAEFASGIYSVVIETNDISITRKLAVKK